MLNKKVDAISSKIKSTKLLDSFTAYVGKEVISKSGEIIGKVSDVLMQGSSIAGVVVKKTLNKVFFDKEFFSVQTDKTIRLSIDPVTMHVGKQVFDVEGKKLGKVTGLVRKSGANKFTHIEVQKRILTKTIKIPKEDISVAKKNIILKKTYN